MTKQIKQIQLRGISRTPSDRMTEDGGCMESLNVQLEAGELGPSPIAKDITDSIFGDGTSVSLTRSTLKYIHKIQSVGNIYIGDRMTSTSGVYNIYAYKQGAGTTAAQYVTIDGSNYGAVNGAPKHFASIGNILIVYTEEEPNYFYYKSGGYIFIGCEIPKLQVNVATHRLNVNGNNYREKRVKIVPEGSLSTFHEWESELYAMWESLSEATPAPDHTNAEIISDLYNDLYHNYADYRVAIDEEIETLWGNASALMEELRMEGTFYAPFFIRFALKLYDGTYVNSTAPILCGAGYAWDWVSFAVDSNEGHQLGINHYWSVRLNNLFNVYYKVGLDAGNWGDLVQSVDVFVSSPIFVPPAQHAKFVSMDENAEVLLAGMEAADRNKKIEDEVLSKGQFFRIKSISPSELDATTHTKRFKLNNDDNVSGDLLYTKPKMPEVYRDGNNYLPLNEVGIYNERVMFSGAQETLTRGDVYLNGQSTFSDVAISASPSEYSFRFKVVDDAGDTHYVTAHYHDGTDVFYSAIIAQGSVDDGENASVENPPLSTLPYAWLFYPDSRCVEVEVYISGTQDMAYSLPMKAHPYLEGAYAFIGMDNALQYVTNGTALSDASGLGTDTRQISRSNVLLISEHNNPYQFPAGGRISFSDNVIGTAVTSTPLSEGQYGQFPIYVFTGGGIRTLALNSEGGISAKSAQPNLARHVAIKGTILGMEQAVVFTTERGVMLLSGSNVTCISEVMNGRHKGIDDGIPSGSTTVASLLSGTDYAVLLTCAAESQPFMSFMTSARPVYDYNGQRLLFVNNSKKFLYVYSLKNGTWHKQTTGADGYGLVNSFPHPIMQLDYSGAISTVSDFSSILDNEDVLSDTTGQNKCIVGTRPFDLGEPDIRKAITDIRVRGRFNRNDVRYILLGSMDGIHWQILTSLRGGSYKLFRLVLVAELAPTERISWIDVQYETRFTNRLR